MQLHTLLYVIEIKVASIINDKPHLVVEHALPLKEIVGWMAHFTILFIHNSSSLKYT